MRHALAAILLLAAAAVVHFQWLAGVVVGIVREVSRLHRLLALLVGVRHVRLVVLLLGCLGRFFLVFDCLGVLWSWSVAGSVSALLLLRLGLAGFWVSG